MFRWIGDHRQAAENILSSVNAGTNGGIHRDGNTACDTGWIGTGRKDRLYETA